VRAKATQREIAANTSVLTDKVAARLATLFKTELSLAGQLEVLKQDLVEAYDFNALRLFQEVDDCNLKFIDQVALKRFLHKCGELVSDKLLQAIIRRWDLDADSKLTKAEFMEGIIPQESYTRKITQEFK
jgi:Ca2+-binding EF-hand superfamily protein